ncbi:N-acetyl-gamma-glutamyl-phosphate reductase [Salsuginibacillus kocurii]|uniref:N-acetyl-gamma-glutamyl-phosphate reductase n=1 Tax=Salsuginibacillus kocurii TaxID=427078 RepID=UPI00036FA661|nr:N-acetyl-gamma-glutamyl-phosphate reductase [Salsuginibacillus kocurii]
MNIAVVGATGYGGIELLRLLHQHPHVSDITLFSSSQAGEALNKNYPHMNSIQEKTLEQLDDSLVSNQYDVVFLSTPAGVSAEWTEKILSSHAKVIDLSGDLRINDESTYREWYGQNTAGPALLERAVYGLTEWNNEAIATAQVIANPGCYPTASLLPLLPLVEQDMIKADSIIIDAKTGTTGAGRSPSEMTHFSELSGNFKTYKVNQHKHLPEMEQELSTVRGARETLTFTPHLLPIPRGIMATIYAEPTETGASAADHLQVLTDVYKDAPFIRVRTSDCFPSTKETYGSNYCDISLTIDERTGRLTIVSVIDNLVKGASGQAIQNMNVMHGFDEKSGLDIVPIYP